MQDTSVYSGSRKPNMPKDWAKEMLGCFDAYKAMTKCELSET